MAESYTVHNARVVLENGVLEGGRVRVRNGRITEIGVPGASSDGSERVDEGVVQIDADGLFLGPGFVELHIHGCDDIGFESSRPDALVHLKEFLVSRGVTTFVPTLQCDLEAIERVATTLEESSSLDGRVPGLYVEGPFVSPERRGGIFERTIRNPDPGYLERVVEASRGRLRLMTMAPELNEIQPIVERVVELGIVPSWGHSACRVEQVPRLDGVSCNITHLFNGMSPISHKESGLAMLPFLRDDLFFELNGDGVHLNAASIRMCHRTLNRDRMILISDAVVSAGRGPGEFSYFGRSVVSGESGVRYEDGTLIGSNCLMPEVVRRFIRATESPLHEAVRLASLNPCRLLGIDDRRGSIAVGKEADLVIFDEELDVKRTFVGSA